MTVVGFLFSVMPMDRHASRYLVALVLVLPFMLLVVGNFVGTRWLALMLCPLVASYAVSGWLAYEPFVDGVRIVDAGWEHNEARLLRELSRRGIRFGIADYWAAYRLTFMFQEQVIVVPLHESQDRYAPYRRALSEGSRYAYIFDPLRSEESTATSQSQIAVGLEEQFKVGPFDVYIVRRAGGSS
jgi:predicted nucleic acid-binding protein